MIASVLLLLSLWPRLCLLAASAGRGDVRLALSLIAVATMALGTNYLHEYLRASLGRLEVFDSPAAPAASYSLGTYYRFRHKYQTARYAGIEPQSNTSDKGRTLVFHLYVATPLLASPADTGRPFAIWQGLHYRAELSARASEAEKQAAYQAFLQRASLQFEQEKFAAPTGYYERIPNTDERATYLRAARRTGLCPPNTSPLLLLQPGQVPFIILQRNAVYHLAGGLSGGTLLFFVVLLFPYLPATSAQKFRARHY